MSDYTRRNEANELRELLHYSNDRVIELEAKCRNLEEKLQEAYNREMPDEEALKKELSYRDGMIAGLKYAIRWMSDGEVNQCQD